METSKIPVPISMLAVSIYIQSLC